MVKVFLLNALTQCNTVFLTRMAALLHSTRLMASQVGRSSRLWRTSSSSSRLVSWPSPFSVLRLILSGDRFLANLRDRDEEKRSFEPENIYRSSFLAKQPDDQTKPPTVWLLVHWKRKERKHIMLSNTCLYK